MFHIALARSVLYHLGTLQAQPARSNYGFVTRRFASLSSRGVERSGKLGSPAQWIVCTMLNDACEVGIASPSVPPRQTLRGSRSPVGSLDGCETGGLEVYDVIIV